MFRKSLLLPLVLSAALPLFAQDSLNFPTLGKVHRFDPRLDELLAADAEIEVITSGFEWTEGPAWNKEGRFLVFSEIPSNTVKKWVEGEGVSDYLYPSGYTGVADYGREPGSNGLLFDPEGRLISCEHGDRRVSIMTKGGGKRTLVDNYQGKRFNSPNDLTLASNGDLYFTDPPYGLPIPQGELHKKRYFTKNKKGQPIRWNSPLAELDFCGIYLLRKSGELVLLSDELPRPNGIALSPNEKTLYIGQSYDRAPVIMKYPVKEDGTIGKGEVFYDFTKFKYPEDGSRVLGMPDGLKVDIHGNVWSSGPEAIYIFSSGGDLLGRLETNEATSNCCWGDDGSTLYFTADTYVCRIKTKSKGLGF